MPPKRASETSGSLSVAGENANCSTTTGRRPLRVDVLFLHTTSMRFLTLACAFGAAAWFAVSAAADGGLGPDLPWSEAGLSERQAAAHLLDRFAYGARPGQINEVVELGLGNWIEGQLAGDLPGSVLDAKLSRMPAATMSHVTVAAISCPPAVAGSRRCYVVGGLLCNAK